MEEGGLCIVIRAIVDTAAKARSHGLLYGLLWLGDRSGVIHISMLKLFDLPSFNVTLASLHRV